MKIGEFLKHSRQRLVTCRPDDTLADVAKLLYAHGIGAMPVCETGQHMIGIISERDLVRVFARTDLGELQYMRARDVMTTRVVTCGPDDTMRGAQELMKSTTSATFPWSMADTCRECFRFATRWRCVCRNRRTK